MCDPRVTTQIHSNCVYRGGLLTILKVTTTWTCFSDAIDIIRYLTTHPLSRCEQHSIPVLHWTNVTSPEGKVISASSILNQPSSSSTMNFSEMRHRLYDVRLTPIIQVSPTLFLRDLCLIMPTTRCKQDMGWPRLYLMTALGFHRVPTTLPWAQINVGS